MPKQRFTTEEIIHKLRDPGLRRCPPNRTAIRACGAAFTVAGRVSW